MKVYTQLTQGDRYQIYALKKAGFSITEIAWWVRRHKSTVSRELRRNLGEKGYRPKQAHTFALARREGKSRPRIGHETWRWVEHLLREDWSPEQVSLWLKKEMQIAVSHERIYQYILLDKRQGGKLYRQLRCQKKQKKRYGSYSRRGIIANQVSIEKRPKIVDRRCRIGDWELDTFFGKNCSGPIVSLTERKSRLALIAKVPDKSAEEVKRAVLKLLRPLADRVHTITSDNGKEFAFHEAIAKRLKTGFYFAHPYASWERGLNENTNGLFRQYLPKSRDFFTLTQKDLQAAMDKLNNRPRKCLGMETPNQVFFGIKPDVALKI